MKKYATGLLALAVAMGLSAFSMVKTSHAPLLNYYWYTPNGATYLGFGEFPNTFCQQEGTGCAKGYISMPADPIGDIPQKTVRPN